MSKQSMVSTLEMIISDMTADAHSMDGRAFEGPVVAEYLGKVMAGIAGLAYVLKKHLEEDFGG